MEIPLIYMFYYFLFILLICTPQLIKNFEIINRFKKKLNYDDIVHKFNTNDYYSIANITNSLITNNENKKCILFYWNNNYLRKRYSNKNFIIDIEDLIHEDKSKNILYSYLVYKYPNGTKNDIWRFCNGTYKTY